MGTESVLNAAVQSLADVAEAAPSTASSMPPLTASASDLLRMLQVIEGEILPKTAQGVSVGNKVVQHTPIHVLGQCCPDGRCMYDQRLMPSCTGVWCGGAGAGARDRCRRHQPRDGVPAVPRRGVCYPAMGGADTGRGPRRFCR
jgi:hypothetical protein